jgi:hypothetical protein
MRGCGVMAYPTRRKNLPKYVVALEVELGVGVAQDVFREFDAVLEERELLFEPCHSRAREGQEELLLLACSTSRAVLLCSRLAPSSGRRPQGPGTLVRFAAPGPPCGTAGLPLLLRRCHHCGEK